MQRKGIFQPSGIHLDALNWFIWSRLFHCNVWRQCSWPLVDSHKTALQSLFSSASRAKRSKIKSFIPVVEHLEDALRFPADLGERLGLQLSKKLAEDPVVASRCAAALAAAQAPSPEAEQEVLSKTLKGGSESGVSRNKAPSRKRNGFL